MQLHLPRSNAFNNHLKCQPFATQRLHSAKQLFCVDLIFSPLLKSTAFQQRSSTALFIIGNYLTNDAEPVWDLFLTEPFCDVIAGEQFEVSRMDVQDESYSRRRILGLLLLSSSNQVILRVKGTT